MFFPLFIPKHFFGPFSYTLWQKISFCSNKWSFYKFSKNEQKRKSNRNVLIFGWKNGKRNCKRNVFSILPQCDCPLKNGGRSSLVCLFCQRRCLSLFLHPLKMHRNHNQLSLAYPSLQILLSDDGEKTRIFIMESWIL